MSEQSCVYQIIYEGQSESPYTWFEYTLSDAEETLELMELLAPQYNWSIVEKDVS